MVVLWPFLSLSRVFVFDSSYFSRMLTAEHSAPEIRHIFVTVECVLTEGLSPIGKVSRVAMDKRCIGDCRTTTVQ